jgi:DNA-binding response OmpR family regulator
VPTERHVPLVVIGSLSSAVANGVAQRLRRDGSVVYITHTAEGCLRVATSLAPDVVLLDPAFPRRVEKLLKAHPASAQARILHLTDAVPRATNVPMPRTPAAA